MFLMPQFSKIHTFLSKLPGFSKPEKNSLTFLNIVQFTGVINDNIYKLAMIFYLIGLQGVAHTNAILSAAGAIFVIPFLLFSSAAGILADRISKNRIIIFIKALEVVIILLAITAFAMKTGWANYAILFLLATQSAIFGPTKYGIIPELVEKDGVSKANGLITSFTYLAIILGTVLASSLTQITGNNYVLVASFCLLVAIIGFVSSFGVKHTEPQGSKKKIQISFVRQIYHTLVECKDQKHLLTCIMSTSFFLFVGGFTQLNIIPFAMDSLGLSQVAGGYLFFVTAVGIAIGAIVSGNLSKKQPELGLAVLSGILFSILFVFLDLFAHNLIAIVLVLILIGFAGGNFIIPFDTFIQLFSPIKNRGHVIAASNFLSFVGVLIASFALYFFNEVIRLSPKSSFAVVGLLSLIVTVYTAIRLSDQFLNWTARKLLYKMYDVKPVNLELVQKTDHPILMLEEATFLKAWLLSGLFCNLHILFPQYRVRRFPWFQRFFFNLHRIDSPQRFEHILEQSQQFKDGSALLAIYLIRKTPVPDQQLLPSFFQRKKDQVIRVSIKKGEERKKREILFSK
jgi:acyl-[acyl-carrier-protein]-phospholipid O-acyltransferase / long-chain-fatty-acid--[acyl-carrier-protein] ligase